MIALAIVCGCRSVVISKYGTELGVRRTDEGYAIKRPLRHRGVDFRAYVEGAPVFAAADGVVTEVKLDDCAGVEILIQHPRFDRFTFYIHLREAYVEPGDKLARGDVIGEVGLYPCSDKVIHVHMELWPVAKQQATGDLEGTEDPLRYDGGCFDRNKTYPADRLVLTYPVKC